MSGASSKTGGSYSVWDNDTSSLVKGADNRQAGGGHQPNSAHSSKANSPAGKGANVPLPAYLQPSPKPSGLDSNYQYSAISGSALRITTTGQLLPNASGVVASPGLSNNSSCTSSPTTRDAWGGGLASSDHGSPLAKRPGSSGGDESSMSRLNQLFAIKNTIARARLQ
jgi:hypothetical protein